MDGELFLAGELDEIQGAVGREDLVLATDGLVKHVALDLNRQPRQFLFRHESPLMRARALIKPTVKLDDEPSPENDGKSAANVISMSLSMSKYSRIRRKGRCSISSRLRTHSTLRYARRIE